MIIKRTKRVSSRLISQIAHQTEPAAILRLKDLLRDVSHLSDSLSKATKADYLVNILLVTIDIQSDTFKKDPSFLRELSYSLGSLESGLSLTLLMEKMYDMLNSHNLRAKIMVADLLVDFLYLRKLEERVLHKPI